MAILENIDARPKSSDLYLWCDYVEIRCLTHKDHKFSRGNLIELFTETAELAAEVLVGDDFDETESADEDAIDSIDEEDAELPQNDRYEAKAADIFRNLAYRATVFGDDYPFLLSAASDELSLQETEPGARELYLQLLLSASLRLVPKKRRHELTEPFEKISTKIFECLMPSGWEVHQFGAKGATRYTGHLFSRLTKLSTDIRGFLDLNKGHYKTRNSGDGGLDIVAWHPLGGDLRNGIPIALAQCGCTAEEWSLKALEASPSGPLGTHLHVMHPWATYYFMPQDLIQMLGGVQDWQRKPDLVRSIVVDRLRLIKLAAQYAVVPLCTTASKQIKEAKQLAIV